MHLSPQVLADAEDEAIRVYRKAGVAISWVECKSARVKAEADVRCQDSPSATRLNLRIVPHASKASDGVFGVAFLSAEGTGAYTDVSYNSAEELDQEWHVGLARVLGHVMAHELGHLLPGSNAHSRQGIMCPAGMEANCSWPARITVVLRGASSIHAGKTSALVGAEDHSHELSLIQISGLEDDPDKRYGPIGTAPNQQSESREN